MKKLCWGYFVLLFLALHIFQAEAIPVKPLKSTYGYSKLDLNGESSAKVDLQIDVIQPTCSTPTGTITVVPDASSIGNTYSINGTDYFTNGTFTNVLPGDYTLTIKNTSGTIIQTTSIVISAPSLPTITLTNALGSNIQSACEDIAIQPITYSITQATSATVTGLPNGVSGKFVSGVLTISGIPTEYGSFIYTITAVGMCNFVETTGVLRIRQATKIILSSAVGTSAQTVCENVQIIDITYDVINANINSVQITGLPTGITGNFVNNVVTISGTSANIGTFTYNISATGVCQSPTVTGTITIGVPPSITLTSAIGSDLQSVCQDVDINTISFAINNATGAIITGLPVGVTGQYNAGIFTISGKTQTIGTFPFTITTKGGCSNIFYNGTLTITENTKLQLTSNASTNLQKLCLGSAILPITYNFTATKVTVTGLPVGITAVLTGVYPNGILTISGTTTQLGMFNFTIDATGTCKPASTTGSIEITNPSTINLSSGIEFQSACEGVKITDISYKINNAIGADVTGLPNGVTGNYIAGIFTITGIPTVYGIFPYQVTTTGGCNAATANGVLNIKKGTQLNLTTSSSTTTQVICIGKPIASINYSSINATNIIVTGLPNGLTSTYLNGTMKIEGTPLVTGSFNYTATAIGDCASPILTGKITILELPIAIIKSDLGNNINKGDVVTLSVSDGINFKWIPATGIISGQGTSSILVRPDQTTTYTVEVSNVTGCSEIGEITLVVNPLIKVIPGNIITPNGNGENDYWTIKNIEYFPDNNVKIYDRAGRLIYNKKGYKNDWDATYNGKPLNEDAYLYVIDLGIGQGLIRGTITIIRNHN